jgi:sensor histidine kinase YesM
MEAQQSLQSLAQVRRAGRWVVALFWMIQLLEVTAFSYAQGGAKTLELLLPRVIVLVVGIVLTLILAEIVVRSSALPFRARLLRTIAAAFAMCLILVPANFAIFNLTHRGRWIDQELATLIFTGFTWSWFLFSVAAALLALTYSVDAADRQRSLARAQAEAKEARIAALRYQLNPHFLFNTLNSVAALVNAGECEPAERMIENLSDFLRVTLELDPVTDIELGREVQLQELYLAIEEVRFPARLRAIVDVPEDLKGALVPALITQPLVENAVRHCVARSLKPVTVRISASRSGDRLRVSVENDGAPASSPPSPGSGTGLGLRNVRARLEGRFGQDQTVDSGPRAAGEFASILEMPLRFAT